MSQLSSSRFRPLHAAIAAGAVLFVVYLITMNRTLGFIDKGELAAVAATLGVAHPTGYPTFTLVGHLFTLLPFRPILSLNILSALATAAGCAVAVLLFLRVLAALESSVSTPSVRRGTGKKKRSEEGDLHVTDTRMPWLHLLLATLGGVLLGLGSIWWGQGNGIEVYSLHAVLLPSVLLLYLRFADAEEHRAENFSVWRASREGIAFAVVLGLAFTNHMSTVFLAPALLVDYFTRGSAPMGRRLRRLAVLVPWTLLGLLPYLYLPLCAMSGPELNWGNPSSFDRFLAHLGGRQYLIWMFNTGALGDQIGWLFAQLPSELGYLGLVLAVLGGVALLTRARRLALLLLGVLVTCLLWAGMYGIYDIGSYFMAALLVLGALAVVGAWELHRRWGGAVAAGALAAAVLLAGALNWKASDESGNVVVEEMVHNVLDALPRRALIFSSQWDFWVSGSIYLQRVEGVRPDVIVIDQELLRRSWYLDQLATLHPALMARARAEVEEFRRAVHPFEQNLPFNAATIDRAYYGMINALIAAGEKEGRTPYVTSEAGPQIGTGRVRVPEGLALRLVSDTLYHPVSFPKWRSTPWFGRVDNYTLKVPELYAVAAAMRMQYEAAYGHASEAEQYRALALRFDPGFDARAIPRLPLRADTLVRRSLEIFGRVAASGGREVPGR